MMITAYGIITINIKAEGNVKYKWTSKQREHKIGKITQPTRKNAEECLFKPWACQAFRDRKEIYIYKYVFQKLNVVECQKKIVNSSPQLIDKQVGNLKREDCCFNYSKKNRYSWKFIISSDEGSFNSSISVGEKIYTNVVVFRW